MVVSSLMASFNIGSYINYLLSIITIVSIGHQINFYTLFTYLSLVAMLILDLPKIYQVIPGILLTFISLTQQKPQVLWPPLITFAYSVNLETAFWSSCHAVSCLYLAFSARINRLKCLLVSSCLIILLVLSAAKQNAHIRGVLAAAAAQNSLDAGKIFFLGTPCF